jgi:hypothetical protein
MAGGEAPAQAAGPETPRGTGREAGGQGRDRRHRDARDRAPATLRGRAAMASAWTAWQLLRLIFLPFILVGMVLRRYRTSAAPPDGRH